MTLNTADLEPLIAFSKRDFKYWNGLPSNLSKEDIEKIWQLSLRGFAKGFLGKNIRQVNYSTAMLPGFKFPVKVWFENRVVILIQIEFPELLIKPEEMISRHGHAPLRLSYNWGSILVEKGEWVFPKQGLAINCNPEQDEIVKLSVFPPINNEQYIDDYYFSEPQIEEPDI